ncbi:MAG: carboxypeptidase-like regulatory domain-containing protein, partial [Bryobacteraceae bacterium]
MTRLVCSIVTAVAIGGSLFFSVLEAQETRGAILGRVLDSTGAAIPNVTVKATNLATNVTVAGKSNDTGAYEVPYVLPGIYRLTAELAGFKAFSRDNIEVRLSDRISIDVRMEVGDITERVTVTADTPLLETSNAGLGQTIDNRRILELPVAHGNPYLLMGAAAGVAHTQSISLDQP